MTKRLNTLLARKTYEHGAIFYFVKSDEHDALMLGT